MLQTRIGRDGIDIFGGHLVEGVFDGVLFFVVYRPSMYFHVSFVKGNSMSHFIDECHKRKRGR